ncbi:hypothetical protein BpHYR1_031706 [Brachionus plicatilis]|uniref:Transmembrane protein n=1 Tax=Brachionus plicatilis TaxID=10195 RepID=A0A3M7QPZ5_BRAPC|nr:hypothetical protein BpHYR1_031706 [Brachionus plicatilis]
MSKILCSLCILSQWPSMESSFSLRLFRIDLFLPDTLLSIDGFDLMALVSKVVVSNVVALIGVEVFVAVVGLVSRLALGLCTICTVEHVLLIQIGFDLIELFAQCVDLLPCALLVHLIKVDQFGAQLNHSIVQLTVLGSELLILVEIVTQLFQGGRLGFHSFVLFVVVLLNIVYLSESFVLQTLFKLVQFLFQAVFKFLSNFSFQQVQFVSVPRLTTLTTLNTLNTLTTLNTLVNRLCTYSMICVEIYLLAQTLNICVQSGVVKAHCVQIVVQIEQLLIQDDAGLEQLDELELELDTAIDWDEHDDNKDDCEADNWQLSLSDQLSTAAKLGQFSCADDIGNTSTFE